MSGYGMKKPESGEPLRQRKEEKPEGFPIAMHGSANPLIVGKEVGGGKREKDYWLIGRETCQ